MGRRRKEWTNLAKMWLTHSRCFSGKEVLAHFAWSQEGC